MDPADDSDEEVNHEEAEGQEQEDRFVPPVLADPVIYSYGDPDGVPIQFPKTAYPSQEMLMEAVIRGVREGKNCLLESPTGTGKTLALLCPVVAWLQKCREEGQDYWRIPNVEDGPCTCDFDVHEDCRIIQEAGGRTWARMYPTLIRIPLEAPPGQGPVEPLEAKEVDKLCTRCRLKYFKRSTPPKIYYTTRTVSQSKGNVRQFLGTHYRDSVSMTILASRDKSCIEKSILERRREAGGMAQASVDVDDECANRRKNYNYNLKHKHDTVPRAKKTPICKYFHRLQDMGPPWMAWQQERHVFDIEDLRREGKDRGMCPYYGATLMHPSAEVVFCTYNYLIYKYVRQASRVDLLNSVVILDEAHNIENVCREATSKSVSYWKLWSVIAKLDESAEKHSALGAPSMADDEYNRLILYFNATLRRLREWIVEVGGDIQLSPLDPSGIAIREFTTAELRTELEGMDLGREIWTQVELNLAELEELEEEGELGDHKLKRSTVRWIRLLVDIFVFVFDDNDPLAATSDFVTCLEKQRSRQQLQGHAMEVEEGPGPGIQGPSSGMRSKRRRREQENPNAFEYHLKIICLNPGLAFDYIRRLARTIIVASGTLSPMAALESELGTPFPIQMSAPHVVPDSNVWVGILHKSEGRKEQSDLKLIKANQGCPDTQDEIGSIILQVARVVPFGVLVFLPSYAFLDELWAQWSEPQGQDGTSLPQQLALHKRIFSESKDDQEFRRDIAEYKRAAVRGQGAIFFGIFRGKVSEGVDFADDEARAVVTLGIPLLNLGASSVKHKMKYNTERSKATPNPLVPRSVRPLSGHQWYDAQGYRALNQGFGRVIRHIGDWGAIFIIEKRFEHPGAGARSKLPNWVARNAQTFESVESSIESLQDFVDEKMRDRPDEPAPQV